MSINQSFTNSKLKLRLEALTNALDRLQEALSTNRSNPLAVDGTIKRYEFSFEMCWKTLKHALNQEGIETASPREAITKAYTSNWINDEQLWLGMLKDRSLSLHIYDEDQANAIYERIIGYYPKLRALLELLQQRYTS